MEPTDPPEATAVSEPPSTAEAEWSAAVVLGDGTTALMRPIRPDDGPALAEFHVRQSDVSRYRRFFSPKPTLRESELERFTHVDFVDRVALVVEDHGEFIAWASYERLQNRDDAEVAFMVDDEHHGRGIATLLLEHMAAIARSNGIKRFTAQTLGDNRGMLAVFSKAGWPVHRRFESGVIDVDFPLADTDEFIDSVERREHRADSRAVARLLQPTSIAVIGASGRTGTVGHAIWSNVRRYAGVPVFPINRDVDTIDGERTYASVADVPNEIGLAIIAVPAAGLRATIDECIESRVRGAVVITVADDIDEMTELVAHARRNGLRIIGPSSFGIASPRPEVELQAALVDVALPAGGVALSMQSGTLASSLLLLANRLHLGMSWFVSLGEKLDVSANDLLQFWEDDEATTVIGLYTESLGNPRKFARIARRVSASKPIIAVRTGAALVGAANAALFQQTGVIEVPTVHALLDTLRVFASQPLMRGDRVAVLSNASSPTVLASAAIESAGLRLVPTPALDWRSTTVDYGDAIREAISDVDVDAVLVVHAPATFDAVTEQVDAIETAAADADKPIVAVMLGANDGPLRPDSPIPNFSFPEQAAAALGRLAAYSAWRETAAETAADEHAAHPASHLDAAAAGALIAAHRETGTIGPVDLGALLATYGVRMPDTRLVDVSAAADTADELGYPVAVKALHRRVGRSAEAGIALDLSDRSDIEAATAVMTEHLGDDAASVYVQAMITPGADLRVHTTIDDQLGPLITVGMGGVNADAIADEASRLAPVSSATALQLIKQTRAASLLTDDEIDPVADLIVRVAQLVSDHDEIAELDLNPVIVSADGCSVADARITLREHGRAEQALRRLD